MRHRIVLEGIVQGVGFRPFVKRLADQFGHFGVTFNTASGLIVEIDSSRPGEADDFAKALCAEAPAAARVESCAVQEIERNGGYSDFRIVPSAARDGRFTLVSPDLAMCAECAAEIADTANRRFGYAFTNCTNCGPRYSITVSTPYDRANTTMAPFPLCTDCAAEYADPANRRFHAEPVACGVCGPELSMDIEKATGVIARGGILAIKGLGGFQLACDAFCASAVDELRTRKRRSRKPFAVMMRDLDTVERYCAMESADRVLLLDAAAPVVLLRPLDAVTFPAGVAPGLEEIGVMLPYTPLHCLLFREQTCLVMTSGNISEEPIVIRNKDAEEKLSGLADGLLMHDRDIFMRVDDSVARTFEGIPRVLRRARGYAPGAIRLAREVAEVLATGAELKNTFCITKGAYAVPSQHVGDLENYETLQFYEETLRNLQSVYQSQPKLIAHDLHPDYLSTRWAAGRAGPKLAVQHHHAHIASCMAENGVNGSVIGVAFDGTGFGSDGQVWGGEFLLCDYYEYRRRAHLRYVALPGGDRAAREGWRMAAAHLHDAFGNSWRDLKLPVVKAATAAQWKVLDRLIERPAVRTSSCGRLFDAVAAMCGISMESSYEGESAMLLESAARHARGEAYPLEIDVETNPWTIDTRPMIRRIAGDIAAGRRAGEIACAFHMTLAAAIALVCGKMREESGVSRVCLSGGTFQNTLLLAEAAARLRGDGFEVIMHSKIPPNDGGISLGQAVIGAAYLERNTFDVSGNSR